MSRADPPARRNPRWCACSAVSARPRLTTSPTPKLECVPLASIGARLRRVAAVRSRSSGCTRCRTHRSVPPTPGIRSSLGFPMTCAITVCSASASLAFGAGRTTAVTAAAYSAASVRATAVSSLHCGNTGRASSGQLATVNVEPILSY